MEMVILSGRGVEYAMRVAKRVGFGHAFPKWKPASGDGPGADVAPVEFRRTEMEFPSRFAAITSGSASEFRFAAMTFELNAPVRRDVNHDDVHRLDVQAHQTPATADARTASGTPRTRVAVGLPSGAPP